MWPPHQSCNDSKRNTTLKTVKPLPSLPIKRRQKKLRILTKKYQSLALKCGKTHNFFVRNKVKLVKHGVVLGEVLVVVNLLLTTKPHAVDYISNTMNVYHQLH